MFSTIVCFFSFCNTNVPFIRRRGIAFGGTTHSSLSRFDCSKDGPCSGRLNLSDRFLDQVTTTVDNVYAKLSGSGNILDLPSHQRESLGVAKVLSKRLSAIQRNNDCPSCWMQSAHCICSQTRSIESSLPKCINRVFLIMHHKEIGLIVDTAKLLLMSMPKKARLVISGISEEYQDSLVELYDALQQRERPCIVLFPTEDAQTFEHLYKSSFTSQRDLSVAVDHMDVDMDVIVVDGTWQQARKIHQRYIPAEKDGGPPRVCLSDAALEFLGDKQNQGRQLRRHPIPWKEISTLEATRLLFRDMIEIERDVSKNHAFNIMSLPDEGTECYSLLRRFQKLSDAAALAQLGPPRQRTR